VALFRTVIRIPRITTKSERAATSSMRVKALLRPRSGRNKEGGRRKEKGERRKEKGGGENAELRRADRENFGVRRSFSASPRLCVSALILSPSFFLPPSSLTPRLCVSALKNRAVA